MAEFARKTPNRILRVSYTTRRSRVRGRMWLKKWSIRWSANRGRCNETRALHKYGQDRFLGIAAQRVFGRRSRRDDRRVRRGLPRPGTGGGDLDGFEDRIAFAECGPDRGRLPCPERRALL